MTTVQMSAEDFVAAPVPNHGRPWNLVDGEVVVNDPTWTHATAQTRILVALTSWCAEAGGRGVAGPGVDIGIDDRNVFVPDVLWYREGRAPVPDPGPPYGIPDLAVEVRSPSTWQYDVGAKRETYEAHGLPELWLVDTVAASVRALRRSEPDGPSFDIERLFGCGDTLPTPQLPGFALAAAYVFA